MSAKPDTFESEAAMCAAYCDWLKAKGWTPYAETAGWDVLAVAPDGFQIGIQAKLALNTAVVSQALEDEGWLGAPTMGPDCRAVLVPAAKCQNGLTQICAALGITVIKAIPGDVSKQGYVYCDSGRGGRVQKRAFSPDVPDARNPWQMGAWFDRCTAQRCTLPEYVPDVVAGASGPVQLTDWKIRAIKIAVLLERRGFVTREDFATLKISISRWLSMAWLTYHATERGKLVRGRMPDFKAQHPRNFVEIEADFDKWAPKTPALLASRQDQA